jgi:ankyrin repeat protein
MNELFKKYKDKSVEKLNELFIASCVDGNLEDIKYLLTTSELKGNVDIHCDNDAGIRLACANGYMEIIKYLLKSPELKEHANIHADNDMAFLNACFRGKFEVVKYLLTSPEIEDRPNIHAMKDRAFEISCKHSDVELAQFLIFDMNIDKTKHIKKYMKMHPNEKIAGYFKIREMNESLEKSLPVKEEVISKRVKL